MAATSRSVQGRWGRHPSEVFPMPESIIFAVAAAADGALPWSYYPQARDAWLRTFYKSEPVIAGAVYTVTSRIGTLDFKITGGSLSQRKRVQKTLMNLEGGQGIRQLAEKWALDMVTTDNGGMLELIGAGDPSGPLKGPVTDICSLDSTQCFRTFDPEYPVVYLDPFDGTLHKLHNTRVIVRSNMTQPDELGRGVGFCPLSRALKAIQTMRSLLQFKHEKVTGRFTRAIGYGSGFTRQGLEDALEAAEKQDSAAGLRVYKGVPFIFPPGHGGTPVDVKLNLLDLASLPDGFDFGEDLTLYVYTIALAFGVDAREFWPASGGGATKADALVQATKARGKGIGDLIQTFETAINTQVMPEGVEFHYNFQDDERDQLVAQTRFTNGMVIRDLRNALVLSDLEGKRQAVLSGVIDPLALDNPSLVEKLVPLDDISSDLVSQMELMDYVPEQPQTLPTTTAFSASGRPSETPGAGKSGKPFGSVPRPGGYPQAKSNEKSLFLNPLDFAELVSIWERLGMTKLADQVRKEVE